MTRVEQVVEPFPLVAVDIGNSRYKFGLFPTPLSAHGPVEPSAMLELPCQESKLAELSEWLAQPGLASARWIIGSVNRPAASRLLDYLREHAPAAQLRLLASGDLPLAVDLPRPDAVGIDRLLAAVAANRLRAPQRPAVVVSFGSAITVNLISAAGAFSGGAILPGIGMSARALHDYTDLLPLVNMSELAAAPDALGRDTLAAMRAGLFWGAVGGARQLIDCYAQHAGATPDIFLTGGAAASVATLFSQSAQYVPHLTLAGVAIVAADVP